MKDMFECYNELPSEVQAVLDKYFEFDCAYESCAKLISELEVIGWTCDYGLDAEPYGLRPIGVELEEIEGYENC